jgi:uncharacterized protein
MTDQDLIANTAAFLQQTLADAEGGHDWWHIFRVWNNAKKIAAHEACDLLVVELAALLHDIADSKFHNGDEAIGPATARAWLMSQSVDNQIIAHVVAIIENISFKGGNEARRFDSIELNIVQDADRLDAIGAIGIARAFHYGGYKGRLLYDPAVPPNLQMTKEEYKTSNAPTLNHFYEKLLLLKDRMNTATGRQIAEERHQLMLVYLEAFYREWS